MLGVVNNTLTKPGLQEINPPPTIDAGPHHLLEDRVLVAAVRHLLAQVLAILASTRPVVSPSGKISRNPRTMA